MPITSRFELKVVIAVAVLFVTLVTLKLHGYSLALWNQTLWQSRETQDILLGHPQFNRSDDWVLEIPLMVAQTQVTPKFPLVNRNIGEGQYMGAPFKNNLASYTGLFRPTAWGFWLGADTGIAFMWWSMVFGLLLVYFYLFSILNRGQSLIALLLSLNVVFSAYFQFWAFHLAEIAIFAGLAFNCFYALLFSKSLSKIVVASISLGWAIGSLFLCFVYPPIQVTVGYWLVFLSIGFLLANRKTLAVQTQRWPRLLGLLLSLTIAGSALYSFWHEGKPWIELIAHTTYPGLRSNPGGVYPWFRLFSDHFFPRTIVRNWGPMGNLCEMSGFLLFFPVIALIRSFQWVQKRSYPSVLEFCLFALIGVNLYYTYIGFPKWLAEISLWSKSTSNRTQMALGLADACLVALFLGRPGEINASSRRLSLGVWILLLAWFGWLMQQAYTELTFIRLGLFLLLNWGLAYGIFHPKSQYRWRGLAVLLVIQLLANLSFNPLARGGVDLMRQSPLAAKILEINQINGGRTHWAVIGNRGETSLMGNLPRMLGVHSIDGYQSHPHFKLWQHWDPNGDFFKIYNQCANVTLSYPSDSQPRFSSAGPGTFNLNLDPRDSHLRELGINYLILLNRPPGLNLNSEFERVFVSPGTEIFQRRLDG